MGGCAQLQDKGYVENEAANEFGQVDENDGGNVEDTDIKGRTIVVTWNERCATRTMNDTIIVCYGTVYTGVTAP